MLRYFSSEECRARAPGVDEHAELVRCVWIDLKEHEEET